jgi:hypothetical protein
MTGIDWAMVVVVLIWSYLVYKIIKATSLQRYTEGT